MEPKSVTGKELSGMKKKKRRHVKIRVHDGQTSSQPKNKPGKSVRKTLWERRGRSQCKMKNP